MDLAAAASYFDNDPVYDAYTGLWLFNAQVSSFNDSHSDGATNRRRIMGLAADLTLPTRQAVKLYGDYWIVGTATPDSFFGEVIHQSCSMKRGTDLMTLLTPGQLLTGAAGTQAWVHKMYFKDVTDNLETSEIATFWNIFIAPGEPAAKGTFLKDATGRLYRAHNDYLVLEGFRICQSDTLNAGAVRTVAWGTGAFDPINDSVAVGTTSVQGVVLEVPQFYRFTDMSDPTIQRGDVAVFVPTTITPKQGDKFTMNGQTWRALMVQPELDAWAVHARRT